MHDVYLIMQKHLPSFTILLSIKIRNSNKYVMPKFNANLWIPIYPCEHTWIKLQINGHQFKNIALSIKNLKTLIIVHTYMLKKDGSIMPFISSWVV